MRRTFFLSFLLLALTALIIHAQEVPLPVKKPLSVPIPTKRPITLKPIPEEKQEAVAPKKEQAPEVPEQKWQAKISIPLPIRDPRRTTLGDVKVTEWPEVDIVKAQEFCRKILKDIPVSYDPAPPMRKGACGSPAPILLKSIGKNPVVTITPPASVNCKMAKALYSWLTLKAQPEAKIQLNAQIKSIRNIASYSCRNRYSNPLKKISEHAFANALDIAGFTTTDGKKVVILKKWGPTRRDYLAQIRKRERKLKKLFEQAQKAKQEKVAKKEAAKITGSIKTNKSDKPAGEKNTEKPDKTEKLPSYIPLPVYKKAFLNGPALDNAGKFLHKIHSGACGIFGTVLGPEANNAHRNHFHFDLAPRKRGPFCE